jgi:Putative Actinobacterial Holin-X, holin superfamily III
MSSSSERPVEELLRDLAEQAGTLVREEIALARTEMVQQARELGVGAGMVGGAGVLGLLSAGAGTAGLILMLARRPRPWFAAVTVSGAYAGGALLLGREGRRRIQEVGVPLPQQAAEELKETAQWRTTSPASGPT